MLIKFLIDKNMFKAGETVDVAETTALNLIAKGQAEAVVLEKAPKKDNNKTGEK